MHKTKGGCGKNYETEYLNRPRRLIFSLLSFESGNKEDVMVNHERVERKFGAWKLNSWPRASIERAIMEPSRGEPRRYAGPSLSPETRKGQPRRKGLRRRSTLPCPLPFLANRSAVLLLRPLLGLPRVDHLGRRSRNSTGERRPRGVEEIGFALSWSIDTVWLIPWRIRGEICRVDNLFCEVDAVLAMYYRKYRCTIIWTYQEK